MTTFGTTMHYELQANTNNWRLFLISSGFPYYTWQKSGLTCEDFPGVHSMTELGGAAGNGCGSPVGITPVITVPDLAQNGCP
jgi:hypothetical protein